MSIWEKDRGQLNHNWLQNSVRVSLNHSLEVLSGRVRVKSVCQVLSDDIRLWEERRDGVCKLLERFEEEMSPRVYFERPPLSYCREDIKAWLIPFIHELWLRREDVYGKVAKARNSYQAVAKTYETVSSALDSLPATPDDDDLQQLEPLVLDLRASCEDLSNALSVFPHVVRIL